MPARSTTAFPRIVTLLAVNASIGAIVGCLAAGGLLLTDTGGLATLLEQNGPGTQIAAGAMLFVSFALTFASLAMASAVMLLGK